MGSLAAGGTDVLMAVAGAGLHAEQRTQGVAECCPVEADLGELGDGFVVVFALDVSSECDTADDVRRICAGAASSCAVRSRAAAQQAQRAVELDPVAGRVCEDLLGLAGCELLLVELEDPGVVSRPRAGVRLKR